MSANNNGHFTEDLCRFMVMSRLNLLTMRHVADNSCRENHNTFFVQ